MDRTRWERISAVSGLAFLALVAIGIGIVPLRPDLSRQEELVGYVTTERSGLLWQGYLSVAAVLFLIWFAGSMRAHLRRNEGEPGRLADVSYGGALVYAAVLTTIAVVNATAAFRPSPTGVVFLGDIAAVALSLGWIPVAVWTGATAISSMRDKAFPLWHATLGTITTIAALLMPALLFGDTGFFSVDRIDASMWMFALTGVWMLCTSILLIVGEAARVEEMPKPHEGWHMRKAAGE